MKLVTLKNRREFQRVSNLGQKKVSRFFVLQAAPQAPKEGDLSVSPLRFGFVITRKMGNAVKRNRIRRRFKAALGEILKDFPIKQGPLDFVIIPRHAADQAPFEMLQQNVREALTKVSFLAYPI